MSLLLFETLHGDYAGVISHASNAGMSHVALVGGNQSLIEELKTRPLRWGWHNAGHAFDAAVFGAPRGRRTIEKS